uniref:Uncharacterized protein n=1 Tax=Panagrolaimus sp. ES5 TaxID=591445 RepID=A0AC34FTE2_9BILA
MQEIFTFAVGSANAGNLVIQKLAMTDPTVSPSKIVYETYLPLNFEVTSQHKTADDACQGIPQAQFGIIAVYGKNNGINIVPSWVTPTTYQINIYFLQGDKVADSKNFTDLVFPTGDKVADSKNFTDLVFPAGDGQKNIYNVTFENNTVSIVSQNDISKTQTQTINPAFLPDFIERKYLSLSFFQPIQSAPSDSIVNNCNLILDYSGTFAWAPNQPPVTTSAPSQV